MNIAFYIQRIGIVLITILLFNSVFAQKFSNKGDRYFDKNLFAEAIEYYMLETKTKTRNQKYKEYAKLKLADCYRIMGEFELAEEMYKKILRRKKNRENPINYLNYGKSLKSSAKYAEAKVQFEEYIKLNPDDPMGNIFLLSCDSAQVWLDETIGKEVKNIEQINTPMSDFSPVFMGSDKLVFSSSQEGSKQALISFNGGMEVHRLDLYALNTSLLNGNEEIVLEGFPKINSPLHEGPATFSSDGKEVYFTRTVKGRKDKKTNEQLNTLQVFYSSQDSTGVWSKPVSAFTFNSSEHSVGQPSLSKDGKTVYFMSDMPGGEGGVDIYYSIKENGIWGFPKNMGNQVNTFGHELFPYISESGVFYFSSGTHPGMGQLDVFSSTFKNGKWQGVSNLKPPINSIGNDFGIVMDGENYRGFISSDRFNGKGAEDIYSFSEFVPLQLSINGGVIQFPDKKVFDGLKYKVVHDESGEETPLVSEDGVYSLSLKEGEDYTLVGKKSIFSYSKIGINILHDTLGRYLEVKLTPTLKKISLEGILLEGPANDSLKALKINGPPLAGITVSLKDASIIKKKNTTDEGYFSFNGYLEPDQEYTLISCKTDDCSIPVVEEIVEEVEPIIEEEIVEEVEPVVEEEVEGIVVPVVEDVVEEVIPVKEEIVVPIVEEVVEEVVPVKEEVVVPVVEEVVEEVVPVKEEIVVPVIEEVVEEIVEPIIEVEVAPVKVLDKNRYHVQVGAFSGSPKFKGVPELFEVKLDNGITKYLSGDFNTHEEATTRRQEMIDKGYEDAFIVKNMKGENKEESITEESPYIASLGIGEVYQVQIGAFTNPPKISNVPEFSKVLTSNGITKLLTGNFNTYEEAVIRRQEMIDKGYKDAFILINTKNSSQTELVAPKEDVKEVAVISPSRVSKTTYRVQIGAFKNTPKISGVPELSKIKLDNGITRYLSGDFKAIEAAVIRRDEMVEKGFVGAVIVVVVE